MSGGIEIGFAFEAFEVFEVVVDHIVAVDEVFAAAEGDLFPGEEGEVIHEPLELVFEGIGKFHGGGHDEDLVAVVELAENVDAVGHKGQMPEEAGAFEPFHDHVLVMFWEAFDPGADEHFLVVDVAAVGAAVPVDHFVHRVGDDFVHVYDDAFHALK